jgi:bifunctional pyridoxal-dependent enzyme with beta-cystathionase and maltose regulon repressor activities
MDIFITQLLESKTQLISEVSEKFHISLNGAKEFLTLAVIEWAKTNYSLHASETTITGSPELIQKLENDIHQWTSNDFTDEDFQILGYCKNIR